jgi:hypothetical protein
MPACSYTLTPVVAEPPAAPQQAMCETTPEQPASTTPARSPYHPVDPANTTARPKDLQIEQTRYSAQSTNHELVPEPPSLSDIRLPARPQPTAEFRQLAATPPEMRPKPVADPVLLTAMRCYLDKRPAEAVLWLDHFDKTTKELLLCLLPMVARLGEGSLQQSDPSEAAALLAQLESVAAKLRPRADLVIDKMCFCNRIEEFGIYQPLEQNPPFRPGEDIELYVEMRNFSSQQVGNSYRLHLTSWVEIRDYRGKVVWLAGIPDHHKRDLSRSPRSDFHIRYGFSMLTKIPRGEYTLWLYVTDEPTGRTAKRSLDFRIVDAASW